MRDYSRRLAVLAALGLSVASAMGLIGDVRAQEEVVPLDKLPKAIVESVKKRFPGLEMVKAEKETEKGKTVYEVSLKNKERNIDVTLTPEGQIQSIEKEIGLQDVPKVVMDAFNAKYDKAKVKVIEEIIHVTNGKESLDYYEFHLTAANNQEIEVLVNPMGKITGEPEPKK